jgi:hypothetical protein
VEVRLGREHLTLAMGIAGSGSIVIEDLPIVETMTVNLYGSPDAFEIAPQSRATQLVIGSLIWKKSFDQERFGCWRWHVKPKRAGSQELIIKVSADLSDSRGVPCQPLRPTRIVSTHCEYVSTSRRPRFAR